ncbi:MAG: VOC family protein [Alphaproteobacteria bacterium]|nr:VOC family protein [Alphaproteobacteria bacterium]
MATPAPTPVPEGFNTVTVQLWFNGDAEQAVRFYQDAFGAKLTGPINYGPGGKGVMHALLGLGSSRIMVADAWPGNSEHGPKESSTAGLWVYVEDCDALFKRAVDAGAESLMAPMDAFWGDRMGKVKDPFGHCWAVATWKEQLSGDEIQEREKAWLASMKG